MTVVATPPALPTTEYIPKESFPSTLHRMLTEIDDISSNDPSMAHLKKVISWQEHGMAFKIHQRQQFINVVMPIWFNRLKYSSFVRQMNLYGFKRIQQDGADKGAMFHENFVRGEPELAESIDKGKKIKSQNDMTSELHFQRLLLNRSQSAPIVRQPNWENKPMQVFPQSLPSSPRHAQVAPPSFHSMAMPPFPPSTGSLRDMLLPILPNCNPSSNRPSLGVTDDFDPFQHIWNTLGDDNLVDDEPLPLNSCQSWDMDLLGVLP